ncbi:MAG: ABC transporter permease [Verrucomicrobia bacterium]|nr:ABC transporter permease [Verrucomicrobiota bacterium]
MKRQWINWPAQVAALTRFAFWSLPRRKGSVAVTVVGIAGVVAVFVGTFSIAEGFRQVLQKSGAPDRAVVMRSGADTELTSFLRREETRIIADAPGVRRRRGRPLCSAELFVIVNLPKRKTGMDVTVPLRGVHSEAFWVHQGVRLVAGRRFVPGRNEIIVGRGALAVCRGLELGSQVKLGRVRWRVVGVFEADGGVEESEIWTDARLLQSVYQRGTTYQSVQVQLESAEAFDRFQAALERDPRLNVKVLRQTDYYADQSRVVTRLVTGLGGLIAGLMALGAMFGAVNTMYAAVAARRRELATLRALGFSGGPLIVSVVIESVAIALAGGVLGGAVAYAGFDGLQTATMNWQSFSQVAFAFRVTPSILARGLACATLVGLAGGLWPAIRAARVPVAAALREL